jgi:hypothetical protein
MTFTPTMKGSFLAGIALWTMLWLGMFKLDEVAELLHLRWWINSERSVRWIRTHRSTSLLGTELLNYSWHGLSSAEGVLFAFGGTMVNTIMIFLVLPWKGGACLRRC